MSRKDAHAFAASLAATLMVSIVVFQAGDGTFGAVPANEIDGDEVQVIAEVDPWAWCPRFLPRARHRALALIWAVRFSHVSVARKFEPTRRSARLAKEPNARSRAHDPPDMSRKSFARATLMKLLYFPERAFRQSRAQPRCRDTSGPAAD